eukprot:gene5311-5347_t
MRADARRTSAPSPACHPRRPTRPQLPTQTPTPRAYMAQRNVLHRPLGKCSGDGMAPTGFTREHYCTRDGKDQGSHLVCLDIRSAQPNFCTTTGQKNWCDEGGDKQGWCVCEWAFDDYLQKMPTDPEEATDPEVQRCNQVKPLVNCEATHEAAVQDLRNKGKEAAA